MKQQIELWAGRRGILQKVDAVQMDSGRILECIFQDYQIPEGASANFYAEKPSGKKIYNHATVSGNTVTVELTNQALAEYGKVPCQVEILQDEKRVSCFSFILDVQKTQISDDAIESMDDTNVLKEYVESAQKSADAAEKSKTDAEAARDRAETARDAAEASQEAAGNSETAARAAQDAAETAQGEAEAARDAAKASEEKALESEKKAAASEGTATTKAGEASESASQAEESRKAAEASAQAAGESETAAGKSQKAAATSEAAAREAQTAAETAQGEAEKSATTATEAAGTATSKAEAASQSADAAKEAQTAAETAKKGAEDSKTAAAASATEAQDWSNQSQSWAVGTGYPARENEATDNSKYYAQQAKKSEEEVSAGAQVLKENKDAIQAIEDNLDAIKEAPDAAARAEAAADRTQSIGQGAKGYYADEAALKAANPTGTNGDWAIVGATDTIWVWDSDSSSWVDTHKTTDLSNYYTKPEMDTKLNEKAPVSHGIHVPEAGTTGQVLKKTEGGIAWGTDNDTVYTHPASAGGGSKASGLYKIATDPQGHVSGTADVVKADITGLGITAGDVGAAAASHVHSQDDITDLKAALAGKAASDHTHTAAQVGALPTTGGTVSGVITEQGGRNVWHAGGKAGTNGVIKIAEFTVIVNYANEPIILTVTQRNNKPETIAFSYQSINALNPDLNWFIYYGAAKPPIRLNRQSESVWALYVQKTEGYDEVDVSDFQYPNYTASHVSVKWTNEQADNFPSECIEPTPALTCSDIGAAASSHTHPAFTTSAAGFVPQGEAGTTKYLRSDGTWQVPPDTKYSHPTGAGNNHIPAGGSENLLLKWKADGEAEWGEAVYRNAGAHNSIYRGKDITDLGIEEICSRISEASFRDLYIGDSFKVHITTSYTPEGEDVELILAGFDTFLYTGPSGTNPGRMMTHHAVCVPYEAFTADAPWDSGGSTTSGYAGSTIHTSVLPAYAAAFAQSGVLGNHLLELPVNLSSGISSTSPTAANAFTWSKTKLCLMSEVQVFGTTIASSSSWYDTGSLMNQFPLFRLNPRFRAGVKANTLNRPYWLSAIRSGNQIVYIPGDNGVWYLPASSSSGVRPFMLIGTP